MRNPDSAGRARSALTIILGIVLSGVSVRAEAPPADAADKPPFKAEELEQMLAPIALYPDSLLTQMLMASTYPMEVVQADRWVKANKDAKGDALTKGLESQSWDASVKSLVNFPPVLAMMSEKLDLTVKIGDAFIGQQKEVMSTIQKLRAKAQETGNLKTTNEQKVTVDQQAGTQVIVIEATDPQVVYIPTYPPTVYYPTWPYPAYPPAPYYPPGYVAGKALAFGAGLAVGAAWGYAWGHSDWNGGSVDIDVNRNTNINRNINRSNYQASNANLKNGQGSFKHDPSHRQGMAYRDNKTASQFGRATPGDAKSRESYRGRDSGGGAGGAGGAGGVGGAGASPRAASPNQGGLSEMDRGGASARTESARGSSSRSSSAKTASPSSSGGGARSGGGGGGGRR